MRFYPHSAQHSGLSFRTCVTLYGGLTEWSRARGTSKLLNGYRFQTAAFPFFFNASLFSLSSVVFYIVHLSEANIFTSHSSQVHLPLKRSGDTGIAKEEGKTQINQGDWSKSLQIPTRDPIFLVSFVGISRGAFMLQSPSAACLSLCHAAIETST